MQTVESFESHVLATWYGSLLDDALSRCDQDDFNQICKDLLIPDSIRPAIQNIYLKLVVTGRMSSSAFVSDCLQWAKFGFPDEIAISCRLSDLSLFAFWADHYLPHSQIIVMSLFSGIKFVFDGFFWSLDESFCVRDAFDKGARPIFNVELSRIRGSFLLDQIAHDYCQRRAA